MRRAFLVLFSLFLVSCASNAVVITPRSSPVLDRFDTVATLLYEVNGHKRPFCSGVFVNHYVVTAANCVVEDDGETSDSVEVGSFRDFNVNTGLFSNTFVFHPVTVWEVEDVALLEPASPLARMHHGSADVAIQDVTYGDTVGAFGNPIGYFYYFSKGQVVSPRRTTDDGQLYTLINATVYPGMSGGPVFNSNGQVVGLVCWGWRSGAWNMVGIAHRRSVERLLKTRVIR